MAEEPEETSGARPDGRPEPERRGGRPVWTGAWWRGRDGPRPVPFTGEWLETESDLAADQWDGTLWRRLR